MAVAGIEMLQASQMIVVIGAATLLLTSCAAPASRTEQYHDWMSEQRVCDKYLGTFAKVPERDYGVLADCGMHPQLPAACEKPGTYNIPACQEWIDQVRSLPAEWRGWDIDDNYYNFRSSRY